MLVSRGIDDLQTVLFSSENSSGHFVLVSGGLYSFQTVLVSSGTEAWRTVLVSCGFSGGKLY